MTFIFSLLTLKIDNQNTAEKKLKSFLLYIADILDHWKGSFQPRIDFANILSSKRDRYLAKAKNEQKKWDTWQVSLVTKNVQKVEH